MANIEIPENVWKFIHRAGDDIGRMEATWFGQDMQSKITESMQVKSPIEQLFLVALHVMCKANYVEVNPEPLELRGEVLDGHGLHIHPQFVVGKYRVDFLLQNIGFGVGAQVRSVIVELDGHNFHDRDKKQRSYEKARDRDLARLGYTVLHYTGSDVVADPYKVAHEAMDTIECFGPVGLVPYDKENPLGIY